MIYDIEGNTLHFAANYLSDEVSSVYDVSGDLIYEKGSDPYISGRLLIFEDDFSSSTLNADYWTIEVGHNSGKSYQTKRRNNAYIENDKYVAMMKKENYLGYTWTAGGITSRGKKSWIYGRFEAKMKLAEAFDSAFWFTGNSFRLMYPDDSETYAYEPHYIGVDGIYNWPQCGEIDVCESWNYSTKYTPQCNLWGSNGQSLGYGEFPNSLDTVNQWHIYAVERTSEYIAMYIDDIEYYRWTLANLDQSLIEAYIDTPISIILGIGIGDSNDESRMNEAKMYVDWVRVYAPEGVTEEVLPTSISIQQSLSFEMGWQTYMVADILPILTTDRTITWVSDDDSIVECLYGGIIKCKQVGETDIYAETSNGLVSNACHITVVPTGTILPASV